ncbi:MAG: aminopeptidase N [Acidimicrobiales bacterium]|nr:MAG: aminopeptidase N [Acidimicrobiales bacterium]
MPGSNLTRIDAAQRAALLHVDSYDVIIDLTDGAGGAGAGTFNSRTQARFSCRQPGADTFIDIVAAAINSATLNGEPVDVSNYHPERGLRLCGLAERNELIIDADCHYMNTGEGLHRFVDPIDDEVYLFSQSETRDAHRIYASFDQPDLKASVTYHVTAPAHWSVISNSPVAELVEAGAAGAGEADKAAKTWHFERTPRIPTYITAIVAGPYHCVRDEHAGLPLGIYCRQSLAQYLDPDDIFEITKQGLDFFNSKFEYPYPFAKYDQLFVPEFNAGAMENAGCVTFTENLLFRSKVTALRYESRANTILHEMAHMWFGNLVTMRWWDDLWLNESFAEWAGHWVCVNATRYKEGWTSFCTQRKAWGYRQDQLSSTHPIAADAPDVETVEVNFDGITYAKGASVLKQLVAYVGEDAFLAALRPYFKAHAFDNASLADLLRALETASGRDLSQWSQLWLQTPSVNTLRPEFSVEDGVYTQFAVRQEAPKEFPTLRPHRIGVGLYDCAPDGTLQRRARIEVDIAAAPTTNLPELVGQKQPAVLLLNDDDLSYTKIRLDASSTETLVRHIDRLDDSLARALCWSAAWDANRDAELATRDYLRLALGGLPNEQAMGVMQVQLAFVLRALELYAEPSWAETGTAALSDAAWAAAERAEPGSDVQLVWVRTAAAAARGDAQLALVRGLLSGTQQLNGLAIDTDLRWQLLHCLLAENAAGEADIVAETERDRSDEGQRQAATGRALIPTAGAKAEAWRLITEPSDLPAQTVLSVLQGFANPRHHEVLAPYTQRYHEAASKAWQDRTSETAHNIAMLLYPTWEPTRQTAQLTDDYLDAHPELPPALRRLMAEGRDGVLRAVAARECDRKAAG